MRQDMLEIVDSYGIILLVSVTEFELRGILHYRMADTLPTKKGRGERHGGAVV